MRSFQWMISATLLAGTVLCAQIEPNAGNWKTWVISSGKDFRAAPPPEGPATREEQRQLRATVEAAQKDAKLQAAIKFWNAGAPGYRWMDIITARDAAGTVGTPATMSRAYAYVAMAMYDATVATWDSKYFYKRQRPSELDARIPGSARFTTLLPVPDSPSYPSEYSAVSSAAAEVLAALFPADATSFRAMAEEAGQSRVNAGLQYSSDHTAGADIGRRVALAVLAKAASDGSTTPFTTPPPVGKCNWVGTNPGNAALIYLKPLLLASANEFRPPPPPACDSPEMVAQTADVRNYPRAVANFATNERVFYWQSVEGRDAFGYRYANLWMDEDGQNQNAPRSARVYALMAGVFFDSFIASNDGKFAYWYIRPSQLDSGIVPIIPVPNFPAYPSNHSTLSAGRTEVLAYLFPDRATFARAIGKEAGDSRIWGGIHFQIDNAAGNELGKKVAQRFIDWASKDGSQ